MQRWSGRNVVLTASCRAGTPLEAQAFFRPDVSKMSKAGQWELHLTADELDEAQQAKEAMEMEMARLQREKQASEAKHAALAAEHEELSQAVLGVVIENMACTMNNEQHEKSADPPNKSTCRICLVNEANYALNPCGHTCYCIHCVPKLKGQWKFTCPICKQHYTEGMRVFC
ncbi:Diap1 [Symbiodinium sp. CCMP2592]|nr:Diap1 [Symbiodinium sp. CCMP2592]